MLFKQIQVYQLTAPITAAPTTIAEQLEHYAFKPCLPSLPSSMGWVPPLDEEASPLARGINGCIMLCLQMEEKILPAFVVGQAVKDKVKKIEANEDRKVRQKEKLSYKDEITQTLLMRAFSKLTRIYAYIDTRNGWLIVNSTSPGKMELFITMFKKSFGDVIAGLDITKPSSIITAWLKDKNNPTEFSVEKSCVLQDPNQQNRVIRCREQDLYATSIQSLVKDGCEAVQLALCWHDRLNFVLADDFTLRGIHLAEDDLAEIKDEFESKQQKFDADLVMMSEMFAGLLNDLLKVFGKQEQSQFAKAG